MPGSNENMLEEDMLISWPCLLLNPHHLKKKKVQTLPLTHPISSSDARVAWGEIQWRHLRHIVRKIVARQECIASGFPNLGELDSLEATPANLEARIQFQNLSGTKSCINKISRSYLNP